MTIHETVCANVVAEVAALEGVEPTELDRPLQDVVDVDALECLVASAEGDSDSTDLAVTFSYRGYEVTVDGTGRVIATERRGARSGPASSGEVGGE